MFKKFDDLLDLFRNEFIQDVRYYNEMTIQRPPRSSLRFSGGSPQ